VKGTYSFAVAVALALVAVSGAVRGSAALSILSGLIAIPVGLYAALATPRPLVPLALATALLGVLVIAWWTYEIITAISGS
jgi:hypothetical protein